MRARLEKGGLMDVLRNQIIERKVIDLILAHAKFKEVPYKPEGSDAEAIDQAAGGEEDESEIPEAKHPGEAEPLRSVEGTRLDHVSCDAADAATDAGARRRSTCQRLAE